jgi:hypothetical protein
MDSIALVGMGLSWKEALSSKADELWGINYIYELTKKSDLKVDRVFDIHELYFYRDSQETVDKHIVHWDFLTSEKPFRFYAPLMYEEVPGMEVYPIQDVMALTKGFGRYTTEENEIKRARLFTSSFDYLMGLAIVELLDGKDSVHGEGKRVELYGWSMGWMKESETEYRYQLPGTSHWIGIALGRGIEVILDKQTDIFKSKMYTYEGASMITRQTLEAFKNGWGLQMQQKQAAFHAAQGHFQTMAELAASKPNNKMYEDSTIAAQHELNEAWKGLMQIETATHVIDNLLANVDTNEIDLDLQSRLIQMVDGELMEAIKDAGIVE